MTSLFTSCFRIPAHCRTEPSIVANGVFLISSESIVPRPPASAFFSASNPRFPGFCAGIAKTSNYAKTAPATTSAYRLQSPFERRALLTTPIPLQR